MQHTLHPLHRGEIRRDADTVRTDLVQYLSFDRSTDDADKEFLEIGGCHVVEFADAFGCQRSDGFEHRITRYRLIDRPSRRAQCIRQPDEDIYSRRTRKPFKVKWSQRLRRPLRYEIVRETRYEGT